MNNKLETIPFTIIGPRVRKSPFFESTRKYGCKAYTVYNHMYMPLYYEDPVSDYWNLLEHVTVWDVACQRQMEITGPDAFRLSQYLTPRNLSKCEIGQCMYTPIVDENGCMLNDPVMIRLAENHFWFSLADSDILLWAKGIAHNMNLQVSISEPFVSPLAVQGPKAEVVMVDLFGDWIEQLRFFRSRETELNGIPLIVARTGWSKQDGFELYLRESRHGGELWEQIMAAGKPYNITPGAPSTIERIESGLLSYGADMDMTNNPFEIGLDKYVDLDQEADFIGKDALIKIRKEGVKQKLVGLELFTEPMMRNENRWTVIKDNKNCGTVRSATYSPRLKKNIALAMVSIEFADDGNKLNVETPSQFVESEVVQVPFS
ncbi:MAG: dimethylsulfoniopropionate demethylase [Anaerolineae bacterium]|nr:dimethylsulfoniopropionate demethylase [Anaerolineae bacterium]